MGKQRKSSKKAEKNPVEKKAPLIKKPIFAPVEPNVKTADIQKLEERITRLERKINSNERFARTFAKSLRAQTVATEAVTEVVRKSFCEDASMRQELHFAMDAYDKRRKRKIISGIFSVIFWILSISIAVFLGAFIHWVFSGQA